MRTQIKTFYNRLNFRKKISYLLTSLFVILIVLSYLVFNYTINQIVNKQVQEELEASTMALVNMVEIAAETSIKNHLRTVADKNLEIVQKYYEDAQKGIISEAEAQRLSKEVMRSQTIGTSGYIYVVNSKGIIQSHAKDDVLGADLSGFEFIQRQIVSKNGYLEYDWQNPDDAFPRKKALYMSYFEPWDWIISASSYRDEFTELIAIDDFKMIFNKIRIKESGYAYVIGKDGTFLIHPSYENDNMLDIINSEGRKIIQEIYDKKNGMLTYTWKNNADNSWREKIAVFKLIPDYQWIVATSVYTKEAYANLNQLKWIQICILLVFLFVMMFFTAKIAQYVAKPLQLLMSKFSANPSMKYKPIEDNPYQDEFGQLIDTYNFFIQELENEVREKEEAFKIISERESRIRTILLTSKDGFIEVNDQQEIIAINEEIQTLLGYEKQELIHQKLQSIFDPSSLSTLEYHLVQRAQGKRTTYEALLKSKSGTAIPVLISASPIYDENGVFEGSFGMITDIRRLKDTLERLETRNQKLTELIDIKDDELDDTRQALVKTQVYEVIAETLAFISHNLNTPLGSSITLASFIKDQLIQSAEPPCDTIIEPINLLEVNLNTCNVLVQDFKLLSSLNNVGKSIPFDAVMIVRELAKVTLSSANQKAVHKITYHVNGPSDLSIYTHLDIFSLVITKIIKCSINESLKSVVMPEIYLEISQKNKWVEIQVRDNGTGIRQDLNSPLIQSNFELKALNQAVEEVLKGRLVLEGKTYTLSIPQTLDN